ncbi:hypothetical protein llap_11110 [Limosa lapponica baueri]|uniref:Uncharacterized protein n=1 Tax=Limosa lapponica baueri TaxID=1758121 RepID=A0A2I0TXP9_LIMLA|nr:hypothetical protein llap_11110 [Limosa lapponica baueri]
MLGSRGTEESKSGFCPVNQLVLRETLYLNQSLSVEEFIAVYLVHHNFDQCLLDITNALKLPIFTLYRVCIYVTGYVIRPYISYGSM